MTAKVHAAAKPVKGAKPAAHKTTAHKARTTTAKTTGKAKSTKTSSKHTAPAHKTTAHKARGFAIGDLLPVCAAEAVAMSLRLAGQRVSDDDVAELHWLAGGTEYEPVSIGAALAAAARFGIGGVRPVPAQLVLATGQRGDALCEVSGVENVSLKRAELVGAELVSLHALILGVDWPGPHCVLATAGGWWSWGQLWTPWACTIEEAWAVTWS